MSNSAEFIWTSISWTWYSPHVLSNLHHNEEYIREKGNSGSSAVLSFPFPHFLVEKPSNLAIWMERADIWWVTIPVGEPTCQHWLNKIKWTWIFEPDEELDKIKPRGPITASSPSEAINACTIYSNLFQQQIASGICQISSTSPMHGAWSCI